MKTLRSLKITSILNGIFCLFCVVFSICLTVNQIYDISAVKTIGVIAAFGWMLNPTPPVSFIINLVIFLDERHSPEARQLIGKKYIFIFIWPVITTLFYFAAMGFLTALTGGV